MLKTNNDIYDAIKAFKKGYTYLFIGRPGQGKTTLLKQLAQHEVLKNGKKVLFCHSHDQLIDDENIESTTIKDSSVLQFVSNITKYVQENKIDVLFIDGLEIFTGKPSDADYKIYRYTRVSYTIKSMAIELNIPVIASFQMSDKQPKGEGEIDDCYISHEERKEYGYGVGARGFDKVFSLFNPAIYRDRIGIESEDNIVSLHLNPENWELKLGWDREKHCFYKIPKTIYIFGSEEATYLPKGFINKINQYISAGCHLILSDNPGTDSLTQDYLSSIDCTDVEVYISGNNASDCRKNAGNWPLKIVENETINHNSYIYDKCQKALMDAHDEYVALTVADDDPSYWKVEGPIYYYESVGHTYDAQAEMVTILDGNGETCHLMGPLSVTTPNGGRVHIDCNPHKDGICMVETEEGYTIELGKRNWGYMTYSSGMCDLDYNDMLYSLYKDDWRTLKEKLPQKFPPYVAPYWEEDTCDLPIRRLDVPGSVNVTPESLMELMNLSYLIKEYDCQSPIVVVRNPNKKKYEVVAGKRRLLACILAGLDTVRCRIIRSEEYRA